MITKQNERALVTAPEHFVRKALEMLENEETPLNPYNVTYITGLLEMAIDEIKDYGQTQRKIFTDICPYQKRITNDGDN